MAKALMVSGEPSGSLGSGQYLNVFGTYSVATTEAVSQAQATEACTFSRLSANIYSGGSGVNNFQFRKNTANGNQLATRTGAGRSEDTVNTDTFASGDLFSIAYTDTGTSSNLAWCSALVEFSSGYGAFVGAANFGGLLHDAASSTRFLPLSGRELPTDGSATEANVAFKVRGFTSFEALQVRVSANARTNDSVFKNRINGADGTGNCTFAAGVTGLVVSSGLGNAITDGQTIDVSITLLTGIQDIFVTFVVATLKSTDIEQDIWGNYVSLARAASATAHYFTIGATTDTLTGLTEANARIPTRTAGTAKNLRCYLSANTYTTDATLKLLKNGTAVMTTTITAAGGAAWYENTANSATFASTDELSYEIVGGTSGSITIESLGMTLVPSPEPTAIAGTDTSSASISDTAAVQSITNIAEAGALTVADSIAIASSQTVADTSALTITEGKDVLVSVAGADTAALTVTDTLALANVLAPTDTSALTITDSSAVQAQFARADTSTLAAADSSALLSTVLRTDTAALTLTESSSNLGALTRTDTAALTLTDAGSVQSGFTGTDTSTLTVVDTSAIQAGNARSDTAALTIAESSTTVVSPSASDTAALTIAMVAEVLLTVSTADSSAIAIADAAAIEVQVQTNDSGSLTFSEVFANTGGIVLTDTSGISLLEETEIQSGIAASDTASLALTDLSSVPAVYSVSDTFGIAIDGELTITIDDWPEAAAVPGVWTEGAAATDIWTESSPTSGTWS